MTLPINREMLEGTYTFLRTTPPFRNWNLPEPEDIQFQVVKDRTRQGFYRRDRHGRPTIYVSIASIGFTSSLIEVMAHEMIHLHEDMLGILYKTTAEHSEAFKRYAVLVCKTHGFDPKLFY